MVVAIISLLLSISLPAIGRVRQCAQNLKNISNQRTVLGAANLFTADYDGDYPKSVATIGKDSFWNWNDPRMMKSSDYISGRKHNSISEYLSDYVESSEPFTSPLSPSKHRYMEDAWEQGDSWDNPDTPSDLDLLIGQYCFYWDYEGLVSRAGRRFIGPSRQAGGGGQSDILVSDYLGFGNWRTPDSLASSRSFDDASVCPEDTTCGAYWFKNGAASMDDLDISISAGFTDGHVESFPANEMVPMWVIMIRPDTVYPLGVGPGVFYLPRKAVE
ncbi:hypothetical protein STSP2_02104 [Anaerohalosphaera lusitana]|uniref:DUF1559 domain-containing protein n=1 Tax=Anaerohalosphaera lusitana TaxID=1936003 RepID=A0A1U9NM90_9BACT|nr:hypothetical protein STSP2_02104 [Anaerohalosphaera lusitana]